MSDYDGEQEAEEDLAHVSIPGGRDGGDLKTTRACKRCGILKTYDQFYEYGCENCPFLRMQDDGERVSACTTAFFEGRAAITDPRQSWAAKWIRVDGFLPGVYAISLTGKFDRDVEDDLENRGILWRCRPATTK